jgi:hypothetical protein
MATLLEFENEYGWHFDTVANGPFWQLKIAIIVRDSLSCDRKGNLGWARGDLQLKKQLLNTFS